MIKHKHVKWVREAVRACKASAKLKRAATRHADSIYGRGNPVMWFDVWDAFIAGAQYQESVR